MPGSLRTKKIRGTFFRAVCEGVFRSAMKNVQKNKLPSLQKKSKRPIVCSYMNLKTDKKILVVEDDGDIRGLLETALSLEGYQVETAVNGQVALDQLSSSITLPDTIVLDLMMPVMDGWRFLEIQKQQDNLRNIPTIVVSATSQQKMPQVTERQAVLKKPIDLSEFLNQVEVFTQSSM